MARFFIDRPIFAWVIAILIMVASAISVTRLPISRYPTIAPPTVTINATYPGASAKAVEDSVTQVIEQSMTGLDGLLYIAATSEANGSSTITLTFDSSVNPDTAQVQVQNKLALATASLPQIVQQQGTRVSKANPGFLMVMGFVSQDGSMDQRDIADYVRGSVTDHQPHDGAVTCACSPCASLARPRQARYLLLTPAESSRRSGPRTRRSRSDSWRHACHPGSSSTPTITAQERLQTP
jgi:multidrug efflux pump